MPPDDRRSRALRRPRRSGSRLLHVGLGLSGLGAPEEAVYSQQAVEIYEELGDLDRLASVLNNLGGLAYVDGRWDETLDLAERARRALETIGDKTSAAFCGLNVAEVSLDQGKVNEVEPLLRDAVRVLRSTGDNLEIAVATSDLGLQAARAGRFDEAGVLLQEARALFEREGDETELLTTDARIGECLVLQGESAAALRLVGETLRRAESLEGVFVVVSTLHRLRGWALMQAMSSRVRSPLSRRAFASPASAKRTSASGAPTTRPR